MRKKAFFYTYNLSLIGVLIYGIFISFVPVKVNAKAESVLHNVRPATLKQYSIPHQSRYAMGYLDSDFQVKHKNPIYVQPPSMPGDDVFKIEASDAIDVVKYSQPDIAYSLLSLNAGMKVPSSTFSKHKLFQTPAQNPSPVNFQEESFPILHASEKDTLKPYRDMRYLDSVASEEASSGVTGGESSDKLEKIFETHNQNDKTNNLHQQTKNNFTDANDNLVSVSSDAVLSYEVPVTEFNESSIENSSLKLDTDIVNDVPSHDYSGYNSSVVSPETTTLLSEHTTPSSVQSNTHVYIDYVSHINLTTEIVSTSIFPSIIGDENVTNSLPSTDSEKRLSSGTVAGIVIAVLICVTLLSSAVIYLLYRKFNGKCTSVVESKFNSDNCGYLDDSLRSSIYLNNHIELPKESSEEMTSLDNDSFLNSLETMTIQNYWADSSKNTKV